MYLNVVLPCLQALTQKVCTKSALVTCCRCSGNVRKLARQAMERSELMAAAVAGGTSQAGNGWFATIGV